MNQATNLGNLFGPAAMAAMVQHFGWARVAGAVPRRHRIRPRRGADVARGDELREDINIMKSIFIDCNHQLEPVWQRVHGAGDPPILVNTAPFKSEDLPRLLDGYDVVLDDHSYMPTPIIAQCKSLKHIVFLGTGAASYMNVAELKDLGVTVHTIKGYGDTAVAEHTIALMFACAREIARMDRTLRAGTWKPLEGMQLLGKTLGIIGLGGIGSETARIAKGIGMKVIAYNRTQRADAPVPLVDLDELLARVRRGLAQSRAQRRDPRFPRCRAHRAHEAGRRSWSTPRAARWSTRTRCSRRCAPATSARPGSTCSTTSR